MTARQLQRLTTLTQNLGILAVYARLPGTKNHNSPRGCNSSLRGRIMDISLDYRRYALTDYRRCILHVGITAARTVEPCPADRSGNYGLLELSFQLVLYGWQYWHANSRHFIRR
jgi:hypothetical protein